MGIITVGFGLALMAEGAIFYLNTSAPTSLIPGYFGIPLVILGFLAVWLPKARMHVMHAAVLITLIGFAIAAFLTVKAIPTISEEGKMTAFAAKAIMALLCAGHVGLSVKSFIDARRSRKQAAAPPAGQLPT